jgi:hypothetical protein
MPDPTVPPIRVADTMAARVAGLDVALLEALSTPEVTAAVDAVLDAEERLRTAAADLSDLLYPVIGAASGSLRGRLVGLRRSLHNLRAPASREWDDEVRAFVAPDLRARVEQWLRTLTESEDSRVTLDKELELAAATVDAALVEALTDPGFGVALLGSSPTLWQQTRRSGLGGAQRRARLARYIGRAAAKTSPRGWFGSWVPARLADGPSPRWEGVGEHRALIEPDLLGLGGWLDEAGADPRVRARVPVRPVHGLVADDDHLRFVDRSGTVVRVGRSPGVDTTLELARTAASRADLVAALARRAGSDEQAEQFVASMEESGLLERRVPYPAGATDPFEALVDSWAELLSDVPALSEGLRRWTGLADDIAGPVDPARRDEHRRSPDMEAMRPAPDASPLWEDTVVVGAQLAVPAAQIRSAQAELAAANRLLGLHDWTLEGRRAFVRLLDAKFPDSASVPLLDAYQATLHDGKGGGLPAPGQDRRAEPDDLARLRTHLTSLTRTCPDPTLDVPAEAITGMLDEAAEDVGVPTSVSLHVQLTPGPEPLILLNDVARGGRAPRRLARLLTRVGGQPPEGLVEDPVGGETVPLDVAGTFRSNMNLRVPATIPVLLVPGDDLAPPPGRVTVDPADLVVRRQGGRLRLWWPGAGTEVVPHPTGLMGELFMPPFARFLVTSFGSAPRKPPLLNQWGRHCLAEPQEVAAFPRVTIGGRVVLERRTHIVDVDALPLRGEAVTDEDLLDMGRFLRRHGIGRRVFVRAVDLDSFAQDGAMLGKERKPLFVDLGSPVWVDLLARLARADEVTHIVFQEALPDPADHPVGADGGRRVTELLLELSCP